MVSIRILGIAAIAVIASAQGVLLNVASSGAATKATITVGLPCAQTTQTVKTSCVTVVENYFRTLNRHGGIDGHHVDVISCTVNGTVGSNCTQSFLPNSNIVAEIGSNETAAFARLTTGHPLASIGPVSIEATDTTSPYAFPISVFSQKGGSLGAIARYELKKGVKNPVLLECQYQDCKDVQVALGTIYGSTSVSSIVAPITAANFTTYVAEAQHDGGKVVLVAEGSAGEAAIVQAGVNLGYKPIWGLTFSCYTQLTLNLLKNVTATMYCPSPFKLWTTVKSSVSKAITRDGVTHWDYEVVDAWVAAHIFVDDVKGIHGAITRQSVISGMKKLTHFTTTFLPNPINFAKSGPTLSPRVTNYDWYIYKLVKGKLVAITKKPIAVPPVAT